MRAGRIALREVAQRRLDFRENRRESGVVEKDAAYGADRDQPISPGCGPAGGRAL
jgi:hypothetical protein